MDVQFGMDDLVCIIIVDYNGVQDTVECINSLRKIINVNYRIIIVDNGSNRPLKDEKIIQEVICDRIDIIQTNANLGFAGGNNYGIRYANDKYHPKYYLLINNDTEVECDFLEEMIKSFESHEHIGLVTGKIMLYSDKKTFWYAGGHVNLSTCVTSHYGAMEHEGGQYDSDASVNFATGCLWLIPQTTIDKVGFLAEDYFLYYEDADYNMRVLNSDLLILYSYKAKIYHKVNRSTGTHSNLERYYMTRNGFLFAYRYAINRSKAYRIHSIMAVKDILKERMKLSIAVKAINDFCKNHLGKQDI